MKHRAIMLVLVITAVVSVGMSGCPTAVAAVPARPCKLQSFNYKLIGLIRRRRSPTDYPSGFV